jgi:hypothetical protein
MADCHDVFQKFYEAIRLDKSKKDNLESGKKALREKIRKHFKENKKVTPPKFYTQGSYAMGTIINPVDGEYDIDDGVYLQNLEQDKSKWPEAETVHQWVLDAVDDHTKNKPIDKRTCIRVIYAGEYHIDLPIYCMHEGKPYLAEKSDMGWHISDPRKITSWFKNELINNGEQLKRIICFFKAWADSKPKSPSLPSGLVLTILATEGFQGDIHEDVSYAKTIASVLDRLNISTVIRNPNDASEDLSERLSKAEMDNFKVRLAALVKNAEEAIKEQDKEKACKIWIREFGERFPLFNEDKEREMAESLSDAINKGELYIKAGAPSIIVGKTKENDPEFRRIPSSRSWRAS